MTDKPDLYSLARALVRSRIRLRKAQEACNDASNDHSMCQTDWANTIYAGNLHDMLPMVCVVDGEMYVIYSDGIMEKATEVKCE